MIFSISILAKAADPLPPSAAFIPFDGKQGYEEIQESPDSWYVAMHGTRDTTWDSVVKAWAVRAAQLCVSVSKPLYVELRYVAEPVLTTDPLPTVAEASSSLLLKVGGSHSTSTVPIVVPVPGQSGAIAPVLTPTKQAAMRCVSRDAPMLFPERAVKVSEVLAQANPGRARP